SLEVFWHKLLDRVRGRRLPASTYYAAESHLREYTPRELRGVLDGALRVQRFAVVGWRTGRKGRLASGLVHAPPFRRFTRTVVVVGGVDDRDELVRRCVFAHRDVGRTVDDVRVADDVLPGQSERARQVDDRAVTDLDAVTPVDGAASQGDQDIVLDHAAGPDVD